MDEVVKWLRALVFIQIQQLASPDERAKPELLLDKAGLSSRDIAELLGKSPDAVRKALQRARVKSKAGDSNE